MAPIILWHSTAQPRPREETGSWKESAPIHAFGVGSRRLWFSRDPAWDKVLGFRGKNDVGKGGGEWNTLLVTRQGDTMTVRLNGVTASQVRRIVLTPLDRRP